MERGIGDGSGPSRVLRLLGVLDSSKRRAAGATLFSLPDGFPEPAAFGADARLLSWGVETVREAERGLSSRLMSAEDPRVSSSAEVTTSLKARDLLFLGS